MRVLPLETIERFSVFGFAAEACTAGIKTTTARVSKTRRIRRIIKQGQR
jgi:hypothetical protein